MFLSYITLAVALSLSVIAAYYSIAGLTAVFAAAVIPIIVMGGILEIGKVVVTLWLHEYWSRCRWLMKMYLVPAVAVLMLITSMGIFGFLSKAHSDQSLVGGDVQAKIAIYDEKIKTEKENIETARRALKQMDEGVDQVLGRSTSETGADRAVALRRSQQKERGRLLAEISQSQKLIAELNETRAPIAAEIRKVEAEVGPLKYIAKLIYGDNPDANLLEKAVTWVIIIIVAVFDPLAIMMLLAATESMKWERQRVFELLRLAPKKDEDEPTADTSVVSEPTPEKSIFEQHPYLLTPFSHFKDLVPMVWPKPGADDVPDDEDLHTEPPAVKAAIKLWKEQNPNKTIKDQRTKLSRGEITQLPWLALVADNELPREPQSGFGSEFPADAAKGDSFVRVDRLPNEVYKHNGNAWILVDKSRTDNYTYNEAYVDYLIAKIDTGEYDIELLSDNEREQISQRLQTKHT